MPYKPKPIRKEVLLLPAFLFYFAAYSQEKLETTALNRVTLSYNDTLYRFFAVKPPKKFKPVQEKNYHWYVKDTILITQDGYDGKLLNGSFHIFYPNKNIMEQGEFKYGLKTGVWKTWYPSGILHQTVNWREGDRNGGFDEYDPAGKKIRSGTYKDNLFTGHIIVYLQSGGLQKIYYRDGKIVVEKEDEKDKPKKTDEKKL